MPNESPADPSGVEPVRFREYFLFFEDRPDQPSPDGRLPAAVFRRLRGAIAFDGNTAAYRSREAAVAARDAAVARHRRLLEGCTAAGGPS